MQLWHRWLQWRGLPGQPEGAVCCKQCCWKCVWTVRFTQHRGCWLGRVSSRRRGNTREIQFLFQEYYWWFWLCQFSLPHPQAAHHHLQRKPHSRASRVWRENQEISAETQELGSCQAKEVFDKNWWSCIKFIIQQTLNIPTFQCCSYWEMWTHSSSWIIFRRWQLHWYSDEDPSTWLWRWRGWE